MRDLITVRRYLIIALALVSCFGIMMPAPSHAGEANAYLALEWFEWKEFNNGTQLLKETGPRYGLGFSYTFEFLKQHLILKPKVEIFGGEVDYDGQTQAGVPVKTDTTYFGGKLEADLGWRFGSLQSTSLEPFAGLGFRAWLRDIQNATASNGTQAIGYTEEWITVYLRAGLRGDIAVGEKARLFAEVGGKFPFYNENTAYLSDAGLGSDVTLKPGNRPSLFAEIGMKYKLVKASLYYDSMRFSKSDVVYSGSIGYLQPKSDADMYGIKIGVAF
ncbi:MAG: hypothetical protein WC539_08030 [Nitrospirota bacterium]